MTIPKNKIGRPTKFTPAFVEKASFFASKGFTDKELAYALDVCVNTIDNWKKKYPEFLGSLKRGKDVFDDLVEKSLAERAMGYSHPHEKLFLREGEVIRVMTTKHYPPDTTAAIFWLKNRRPEQWRDKHEINTIDSQEYINIIQQRRAKALEAMQVERALPRQI